MHPAGHILGSAQVRIEHAGRVWVVSGDYKRQPDPTCSAFEPLECNVFVSEATFALPVYRWPATADVVADIRRWWSANRERGLSSILFCYALGKAQRVLAELVAFTQEPVYVHGAVGALVDLYRRCGIDVYKRQPTPCATSPARRVPRATRPPSSQRSCICANCRRRRTFRFFWQRA